jgi:hypothetical protein
MNPYRSVSNAIGTSEALAMAHRLEVWHDAMVLHQRSAGGSPGPLCDENCPHVEARQLWLEAVEMYGERAYGLRFLRSHGALPAGALSSPSVGACV